MKTNIPHNTAKIVIDNVEVVLSERTASDVNRLLAFAQQHENKLFQDYLIEYAVVIEDGLKYYIQSIPRWQLIKRWKAKKLCSASNILSKLTARRIYELALKVYELEGVDVKKKAKLNEERISAETSETA